MRGRVTKGEGEQTVTDRSKLKGLERSLWYEPEDSTTSVVHLEFLQGELNYLYKAACILVARM